MLAAGVQAVSDGISLRHTGSNRFQKYEAVISCKATTLQQYSQTVRVATCPDSQPVSNST